MVPTLSLIKLLGPLFFGMPTCGWNSSEGPQDSLKTGNYGHVLRLAEISKHECQYGWKVMHWK